MPVPYNLQPASGLTSKRDLNFKQALTEVTSKKSPMIFSGTQNYVDSRSCFRAVFFAVAGLFIHILSAAAPVPAFAAGNPDRETVTISVVAANPSADTQKTFPIRIDLPQEVTPEGVVESGDLKLTYDDQKKTYFLYNQAVILKPKETRVFNVVVKDVWFILPKTLDELEKHGDLILDRLKDSEFFDTGKEIMDSIKKRLEEISVKQADESIGQKVRIGQYRYNLQTIAEIKEDLAKMEKLLTFQGSVPVPEILENSKLKSDAPSSKTTWLIILSIMIFMGLLGSQFYITWQKRVRAENEFYEKQNDDVPGDTPKKN